MNKKILVPKWVARQQNKMFNNFFVDSVCGLEIPQYCGMLRVISKAADNKKINCVNPEYD